MTELRYTGPTNLLVPAVGYLRPDDVVDVDDVLAAELAARDDFKLAKARPVDTIATIKARVGDDPAAAAAELTEELAQPEPRSTLVAWLEALAATAPDTDPDLDNEDATSANLTDPEETNP